jgi:transcriptional regulator with XRE-family HTH domain
MTREQEASSGTEFGRYLRARRGQVTPAQAGLAPGPGLRRTAGLRREELATIAGVSVDYYTRLERGKETRPSPAVVDALARALRLGEDEHDHLRELALRAARHAPQPPVAPSRAVRPGIELILESLRPNPAYVVSRVNDLLASNPGGLQMFPGIDDWPPRQRNVSRYLFLHPDARQVVDDWDKQLGSCVAGLRALAGTDPEAPDLVGLVGELLVKSPDFARLWERYEVRGRRYGQKTINHPRVGSVTLGFQCMQLEGTPGQRLYVHFAEPGSPEHDTMVLLDLLPAKDEVSSPAESAGNGRLGTA